MMSKISVELEWEAIDHIVVSQLRDTWETLKNDLGANNHVFVWSDQDADDEIHGGIKEISSGHSQGMGDALVMRTVGVRMRRFTISQYMVS